jgi:hypothetical protein
MIGIARRVAVYLVVMTCSACGASGQQAPRGWKAFTSSSGGYTAYYPPNWGPLVAGGANMEVVNFPPSKKERAVLLPPGGALINIVGPPSAKVTSVEQWLAWDSARGSLSHTTLFLPRPAKEPTRITEVLQQPIEGEETVACYFDLSGHLLAGHVVYWKGDPNAGQYVGLLHKIIGHTHL